MESTNRSFGPENPIPLPTLTFPPPSILIFRVHLLGSFPRSLNYPRQSVRMINGGVSSSSGRVINVGPGRVKMALHVINRRTIPTPRRKYTRTAFSLSFNRTEPGERRWGRHIRGGRWGSERAPNEQGDHRHTKRTSRHCGAKHPPPCRPVSARNLPSDGQRRPGRAICHGPDRFVRRRRARPPELRLMSRGAPKK